MSIRMSELPHLTGTRVTIEIQEQGDTKPWEIEGTLVATSVTGVVVKNNDGTHIVMFVDILDVSRSDAPRKVVRRKIRFITVQQSRQHLLDRHGMPWDMIKMLKPQQAWAMHQKIDHSNLGHQHNTEGDTEDEEAEG